VRNLDHVLQLMAYSVARFSLVAAFVVAVASGTSERPGIIATTALAFALIGTFAARFTCRASSPVRRRLWRHLTQREAFLFPAYAQLAVCGFLLAATVVPRDLSQLMACAAGVSAVGALVLYTRAERRLGLNRRYNNHSQRRSVSQVTRVAVFMVFAAAACTPFPSTRLAGLVFTAAFGFIAWSWYVRPTLARRRRATRSDT
jgi:hypothetical protein